MANMNNASGDPVVTRVNHPEHFSSEPDNTALYVPKGMQYTTSMQQTRFNLPYCDGPVRSHATVALTESAIMVDRQRSWKMLNRTADAGDEQAQAVIEALRGFAIE